MSDLSGQQWGIYRLLRLLGQGGFASVYLGEHMRLKTQVAVKILHTFLSQEGSESFLREAQTVASFIHPHIVRVFDFDVQENHPFLVMDYAPHGSLSQLHPTGTRVPLAQVVSYVKPLASALQYAHDQRLIHRDVKPQNMLVNHRKEILLSDFGIVAMAHSTSSMDTGSVVGTLLYMAPEQIQGKPRPASDQYALAVTAYSWLTGTLPFKGSTTEVVAQHLSVAPQPLRTLAPDLPTEVEQVILTALAKDPKNRFGSVVAFAHALEQVASGQTTELQQPRPPMSTAIENAPVQGVPVAAVASPQHAATPPQRAMQEKKAEPVTPRTSGVIDANAQLSDGKQPFSRRKLLVASGIGLGALGLGALYLPGFFRSGSSGLHSSEPSGPQISTYTISSVSPRINGVFWSPDSSRLALFLYVRKDEGEEDIIHVSNSLDGSNAITFPLRRLISPNDFVWSGNSLLMAWVDDDFKVPPVVTITDVTIKKDISSYFGHVERDEFISAIAWSPTAQVVATAADSSRNEEAAERSVITIWDAATGKDIVMCKVKPTEEPGYEFLKDAFSQGLFARNLAPTNLLWSPDGTRLISWKYDALFTVWDVNGTLVSRYTRHWEERKEEQKDQLAERGYMFATNTIGSWSPDGTRILSVVKVYTSDQGLDKYSFSIHLWEAATGKHIRTYTFDKTEYYLGKPSWSPDGQFFLVYEVSYNFSVWSANDGSQVYRFVYDDQKARGLGWIPSAKSRLAFTHNFKDLWVWDATTNQATRAYSESDLSESLISNVSSAIWSPDGKYIAICDSHYNPGGVKVNIWKAP